jgi:hypothetical protein
LTTFFYRDPYLQGPYLNDGGAGPLQADPNSIDDDLGDLHGYGRSDKNGEYPFLSRYSGRPGSSSSYADTFKIHAETHQNDKVYEDISLHRYPLMSDAGYRYGTPVLLKRLGLASKGPNDGSAGELVPSKNQSDRSRPWMRGSKDDATSANSPRLGESSGRLQKVSVNSDKSQVRQLTGSELSKK